MYICNVEYGGSPPQQLTKYQSIKTTNNMTTLSKTTLTMPDADTKEGLWPHVGITEAMVDELCDNYIGLGF